MAHERKAGHAFQHIQISGGNVHLGDEFSQGQQTRTRKKSNAWEAQPEFLDPPNEASGSINRLYVVPRSSRSHFTGRTLQTGLIKEYLLSQDQADRRKVVVLVGLGGSGKTQVCLKFTEINRGCYWGIFWIDASSKSNAEACYSELGRQAGRGQTFAAGKYWLSECTRPWLLILDNADEDSFDITEMFPTGDLGHILISTRNRNLEIHATHQPISFHGMDPEEAVDLLLSSAYPGRQLAEVDAPKRSVAKAIATKLGHLAIALDLAGATIRRKIYTIEEYLHCYLDHRKNLAQLFQTIPTDEINVVATWDIPFERIEKRETIQHRDAATLMHVIAFLHFDSISKSLLSAAWDNKDGITCPAQLPDLFQGKRMPPMEGESRLRQAIAILSDHSMIEYDVAANTCSLHPVVHAWARSRIRDSNQLLYWLKCTSYLLARCCSARLDTSDARQKAALLPHVGACLSLMESISPAFLYERHGADIVEVFAALYEANGIWNKSLELLEHVLKCRKASLGRWHQATLRTQRNMSRNCWNLFQVKSAIEIQYEVLKVRWYLRPSLLDWAHPWKPDHLAYCIALDDLTQTLWLAGEKSLSKMTGERAVTGFLRRLGSDEEATWNAMFNLGRTLLHLKELESAQQLLAFVSRKRKQRLGMKHPNTLMVRNELGMCLLASRKHLLVAERLVRGVLEDRRSVLGLEHAYTLWSENDFSKVLLEQGRASEAVQVLERIVPIVARTLGNTHVGMHMTKGNLARSYVKCGRWTDAETTMKQILAFTDESHPDWFQQMSGYAHIEIQLDKIDEAERICRDLQEKLSRKQGDSHQMQVVAKILARVYHRQARHDQLLALQLQYPNITSEWIVGSGSPV